MVTPAAKRRRVDAANKALSKPFRSPFKTPLKQPLGVNENGSSISTPTTPAIKHWEASRLGSASPQSSLNSPLAFPTTKITPQANSTGKKKTFISPASTAALNSDPDIAPLIEAQRALEKQIRELKVEIDTAEQARKIEAESRKKDPEGGIDGELMALVGKWTDASRLAAEEMFGKVRDRVNRMGGPRAWKEMQKLQDEWRGQWDTEGQEVKKGNDEEDGDQAEGEKRDVYAEYGVDPETENEKIARGTMDTGEMPGQEDEFTMAMMLRTLNIDLAIIGYDKEQQRWIE